MTLKTDSTIKVWYPMNEGSGTTVYDYSGNSNNGSASNVTLFKSKNGKGTNSFNGSSSGITLSSNPSLLTSFSVCFWAKPVADIGMIFAKDAGSINSDIQYRVNCWDFAFHFELGNTANARYRASTIEYVLFGTWYFVVSTFDSSTGAMKIYLNGLESGTATFTGTRVSNDSPTYIGRRHNGVYYNGQLKDFMLFEKVLTLNEIKDLYKQTYIE